jgi:hypothetical protein
MQIDRYQIITNISPNRKMPIYIELKKIHYKILLLWSGFRIYWYMH